MIKTVLIDLSGTLHVDKSAIPGAPEALSKLRAANIRIKFVTNTTKESKRLLHENLTNLGFIIEKEEIFTSLTAANELIVKKNYNPLYLVANEALEDLPKQKPADKVDAVVIGLAPNEFHYEKLNEAFRYLNEGASLIAIHDGRYYKRKDGLALGPGCFVKGLEYSAGVKAQVVGKPNVSFFHSALLDEKPNEVVMVGDDIQSDIGGAILAGMLGILVQTGKYQDSDLTKFSDIKPTVIVPSFVEAVDAIIKMNATSAISEQQH